MSQTRKAAEAVYARPGQRTPLTRPGKLTLVALVGLALSYLYLVVVLIGELVPLAITVPVALLLAGLVSNGWRSAPAVAALVCTVGLIPEIPLLPGHLGQFDSNLPAFVVNVLHKLQVADRKGAVARAREAGLGQDRL